MATRLLFIAHAETRAARQGIFARDDALTESSHAAAKLLRPRLPNFASVAASPASAARETAAALGLAPQLDPTLRGLDLGRWVGRSLIEIARDDPAAAAAWIADPSYAGHGGEAVESVVARVDRWLTDRKASSESMLVITHAPVLRAAVVSVLEAPTVAFWRVDVGPLTMLTLTSDGRRWAVKNLGSWQE